MINLNAVTVVLGSRKVLCDLNLHVDKCETLALSGESGSGKSTLLRTLIGQHQTTQGEIAIDGMPLEIGCLDAIRSRIAFLPQDVQPLGDEKTDAFLSMPFCFGINRDRLYEEDHTRDLFDRLGLSWHLMQSRLRDLSGGERKRIGLIQVLLLKRPILLLDEPTSAVDKENSRRLVDVLTAQEETTIVAVTHDPCFVARATRHVVVQNGQIQTGEG